MLEKYFIPQVSLFLPEWLLITENQLFYWLPLNYPMCYQEMKSGLEIYHMTKESR